LPNDKPRLFALSGELQSVFTHSVCPASETRELDIFKDRIARNIAALVIAARDIDRSSADEPVLTDS
jgi:hypothetical protein